MSGFRELSIYQEAYKLAIRIHRESLKLPAFELYEQGSQIRRSSKGIKDAISEGYGRRKYKADYVKFLTYSIGSCDETLNHLITINELYPEFPVFGELIPDLEKLGKMINSYLNYVEENWNN